MRIRQNLALATIGTTVLGVGAFGVASAEETPGPLPELTSTVEVPASYAALSAGEALRLNVFGQELTVGRTLSGLDSTLTANATGTGVATPLFDGGVTQAQVSGDGADGSEEEVCEFELNEVPGLGIGLACSSSFASVFNGLPAANSTGRVGNVSINPIAPIIETPLAEVVTQVDGGVEQLLDGLRPVTSGVDDALGLGVEDTLDDLFHALFEGADLVTLDIGATTARTVTAEQAVASTCAANGSRIDVLDMPAVVQTEGDVDEVLDAPPVLSVIIGNAATTVDVDTTNGNAIPTVDPAIVTVIVPSMGLEQSVVAGQTIEIPLPEPFGTSTIQVADGTTGVDEDGQTFATANGVALDLLNGEAFQGGIELALASCTSVAGAVQPVVAAAPPAAPVPTLPQTGGGVPGGLVLVGSFALAGVALNVLRRRGVDA